MGGSAEESCCDCSSDGSVFLVAYTDHSDEERLM